jgi:nitrate/nitrite transport system permease protein
MSTLATTPPAAARPPAAANRTASAPRLPGWLRSGAIAAACTAAGFGLLILLWAVAAWFSVDRSIPGMPRQLLPGPVETLPALWQMLLDPFYDNGPNDKGIGLQALHSLAHVFHGWGVGLLIAIPLGILLGTSRIARSILDPVVQTLRPVSPLAWFPLGLAVMQSAPDATVFVIVITSLWPTLINTMYGVMSLPDDYRNVARVFRFSRFQYVTKVVLPYAVPHILTGMRLSMGIAWLVIVAAEMLAGGTGLGYFIWDAYNAGSLTRVLGAIIVIGVIGLLLDRAFDLLARRLSFT